MAVLPDQGLRRRSAYEPWPIAVRPHSPLIPSALLRGSLGHRCRPQPVDCGPAPPRKPERLGTVRTVALPPDPTHTMLEVPRFCWPGSVKSNAARKSSIKTQKNRALDPLPLAPSQGPPRPGLPQLPCAWLTLLTLRTSVYRS